MPFSHLAAVVSSLLASVQFEVLLPSFLAQPTFPKTCLLRVTIVAAGAVAAGWILWRRRQSERGLAAQPTTDTGKPVLVLFYSGGLNAQSGRGMLNAFSEAATAGGWTEQLVLDHMTEPCPSWQTYVAHLKAQCDAAHAGCSVAIVAHSHGCVAAYALAAALGPRVRLLCVACRRPPDQGLLDEVLGVSSGKYLKQVDNPTLFRLFDEAWPNPYLAKYAAQKESEWPEKVKAPNLAGCGQGGWCARDVWAPNLAHHVHAACESSESGRCSSWLR